MAEMTDHIVAFGDVLGVSSATSDDDRRKIFSDRLIKAHADILPQVKSLKKISNISVNFYSDSIIMCGEIKNNESIKQLLHHMAIIQARCAVYGLFMRGGVALGPHYHDDSIDFGPALVEAVRLEANISGDTAKITLSKCLAEKIKDQDLQIVKDGRDGTIFLHFLNFIQERKHMKQLREFIKDELEYAKSSHASLSVHSKIAWLVQYFNWYLSSNNMHPEILPIQHNFSDFSYL